MMNQNPIPAASLALAAVTCLAPGSFALSQDTLVADLNPTSTTANPDGQVRPRGSALGLLWIESLSSFEDTSVWVLDTPDSEPRPFRLPELAANPSTYAFRGVSPLSNGRALLTLQIGGLLRFVSTDGTFEGSFELPLNAVIGGLGNNSTLDQEVLGGEAYLLIEEAPGQRRVWATDGSPGGLRAVTPAERTVLSFGLLGNRVVYVSDTPGSLRELRAVSLQGTGDELLRSVGSNFGGFAPLEVNGQLVFAWASEDNLEPGFAGFELWRTDGTPVGTQLVADIEPGSTGSAPILLASTGSQVVFSAKREAEGRELWATDGTAAGTRLVLDLVPGPANGLATNTVEAAALGDQVVFRAPDGQGGSEPWVTDGTAAGTLPLASLPGGVQVENVTEIRAVGGRVAFDGRDPFLGVEAFATDGQSMERLADANPGPASGDAGEFAEFAGRIYFGAVTAGLGRELWNSGVTGPQVQEIGAPAENGSSFPSAFVEVAGAGYFVGTFGESETQILYRTDGTSEGTRVMASAPRVRPIGALDLGLVFGLEDASGDFEPWFTDGTEAGTLQLADLAPGPQASLANVLPDGVQLGQRLFFTAFTPATGTELFATDGTPEGTGLAVELASGSTGGFEGLTPIERIDDALYFRAVGDDPDAGLRLWRTDGTDAGTFALDPAGALGGSVQDFVESEGTVLFAAQSDATTYAVGRTEGVPGDEVALAERTGLVSTIAAIGGTALVVERSAADSSVRLLAIDGAGVAEALLELPGGLISFRGSVPGGQYLEVFDFGQGPSDLWFTDGSPGGTLFVDSEVNGLGRIGSGGELFLRRYAPETGFEAGLVLDAGAGVELLADVEPGFRSSDPRPLGRAGDRFLFSAFTLANGRELHGVTLLQAGAFAAAAYGQGCGGAAQPDLAVEGEVRLGESVAIAVSDAKPFAPVAYYAAAQPAVAPLGGCTVYLAAPLNIGVAQTGPDGRGELGVALTGSSAFLGLELYLQSAVVAFGGPALGAFELTNGVEVVFGE